MFALRASLALLVFSVGLTASAGDASFLIRRPGLFARSVLSMNVIMPLLALWMAVVLSLNPAIELALIALAMSPVPPFLPLKTAKVGGGASYTVSLLAMESLLSIVLVPVTVWAFGALFGRSVYVAPRVIARIVVTGILLPLAAGVVAHVLWPPAARRIARVVRAIAIALLLVGVVPLVVRAWHPMVSLIGDGTIVAILVLTLGGLGVGHVLGGPEPTDRPVLALATATRHPAVALVIITTAFPDERLAPAAVLLALIITALASLPYMSSVRGETEPRGERQLFAPSGRVYSPGSRSAHHRPATAIPARRRRDRRP